MRALVLSSLIGLGALLAEPALAHEWYPLECCAGYDCGPALPGEVSITPGGYYISTSREIIPYSDRRVRQMPMSTPMEERDRFHVCHVGGDAGRPVRCLFVPDAGA